MKPVILILVLIRVPTDNLFTIIYLDTEKFIVNPSPSETVTRRSSDGASYQVIPSTVIAAYILQDIAVRLREAEKMDVEDRICFLRRIQREMEKILMMPNSNLDRPVLTGRN